MEQVAADLTGWLVVQVAQDEREAHLAFSGQMDPENGWGEHGRAVTPHVGVIHEDIQRAHVVKWNPARVLVECDVKRRILAVHHRAGSVYPGDRDDPRCVGCGFDGDEEPVTPHIDQCPTLRALALPYADRPGYRAEWRPAVEDGETK